MSTDEANGARRREFHARLAKSISSREVVRCIHMDGDDALASLDTGRRSDVLTKSTTHSLRNTVSTSTGGLLVLSEDVVWESVDAEGIALGTGFLTNGGVGYDTGRFKRRVANLNIVVGSEFKDHLELACLSSTAVTDVELHDSVVGYTTDVLSTGVGWAFQAAVHHCWFTCHRYASKHPCDQCSPYDISAHEFNSLSPGINLVEAKSSSCAAPSPRHGWQVAASP